METKTCSKCKTEKPLAMFSKNRAMKGGYCWWCKECSRAKERIAYHANIEQSREDGRAKAAKHAERRHVYYRQWYLQNRDAKLAQNRQWRLDNPERIKALITQWFQDHPEKMHAYQQIKRSRKAGAAITDLSPAQWQEILLVFNHRCAYCGRKSKSLAQDHITPVAESGNYTLHNIVPACKSCNSRKSDGPVLSPVQPLLLTIAPSQKKRTS